MEYAPEGGSESEEVHGNGEGNHAAQGDGEEKL